MSNKHRPIFITGRFRAGTSFLWQIFNQMDGFCAWYEPLHPQLLQAIEHVDPKVDHVGIDDYWGTYRSYPEFEKKYSSEFGTRLLYLEGGQEYPELMEYLNHLIELSSPDIPVLQFNRMDFRLDWLKQQFPEALIVHIERNPLQLYFSQRKHIDEFLRHRPNYWDAYELAQWSFALSQTFPFLVTKAATEHAFYRFYTIYQLSRLMAKAHADIHINLDTDVFQSDCFAEKLTGALDLSDEQQQVMTRLLNVPDLPDFDQDGGTELIEIMTEVDYVLSQSGLLESFGRLPLETIKAEHHAFWRPLKASINAQRQMQELAENMCAEVNRIIQENASITEQINACESGYVIKLKYHQEAKPVTSSKDVLTMLNDTNALNALMTAVLSEHRKLKQKLVDIMAQAEEKKDKEDPS
ncbi:MAG: sulfotransferase [Xanthomonadales bacterium]|nr:sulfotransferase [Xanthomonadales bacterium]